MSENPDDATAFPWRAVMALGLGRLRLAPRDFWAMTPRELAAAGEGAFGARASPLVRGELDALMARFPDGPRSNPSVGVRR